MAPLFPFVFLLSPTKYIIYKDKEPFRYNTANYTTIYRKSLLEFIGNATEFATDFSVAKKFNFVTDMGKKRAKTLSKN